MVSLLTVNEQITPICDGIYSLWCVVLSILRSCLYKSCIAAAFYQKPGFRRGVIRGFHPLEQSSCHKSGLIRNSLQSKTQHKGRHFLCHAVILVTKI